MALLTCASNREPWETMGCMVPGAAWGLSAEVDLRHVVLAVYLGACRVIGI